MSFDARSLERLKELGRTLPQPLPQPESAPPPPASTKRHRVETETDPEALFRELMQVSPDGSVPPHLMQRLRQAETDAAARRRPALPLPGTPAARPSQSTRQQRRGQVPAPPRDPEMQDLYVAFQHLLLEDEPEG